VPVVFEHGTQGKYFFIAMEYLSGRNLSEVIGEGPMAPARAVRIAMQLCEFLRDASAFERTLDGRRFNLLLHGDLKPRNIRVLDGDEVKVFDFGIAKALSLSRKVTRNDFGSIAYLSPERLESGEIDAQAEFWAVGVLLYEMISGTQPFRAPDTRRLEQRIRARQLPATLDNGCPIALQAIVAKLLAPDVADRYHSAMAIHDDLRRFASGEEVVAEREGWPLRGSDEGATRRTHRPAPASTHAPAVNETEVTRRTIRESPTTPAPSAVPIKPLPAAAPVAAKQPPAVPGTVAAPAPAPATVAAQPKRGRIRRFLRKALMVVAIFVVLNEIRIYNIAAALAPNVPQDASGLLQMWGQRASLDGGLNIGIMPLERALIQQSEALAERTFDRYRTAAAPVFEREWRSVRDVLTLAARTNSSDRQFRSALRYCEGHLRRIDGEARVKARQTAAAQQEFTAAVAAFRSAAEIRGDWPDPFLGLMRTFIVMEDIERGADALAQAQRLGYTAVNRDWALLGEGYLARGAKLAASEELEPLNRAADAYATAIDYLTKAAGYGNVAQRLREARRRQTEVQERREKLNNPIDQDSAA
jgi:hypothetical protein